MTHQNNLFHLLPLKRGSTNYAAWAPSSAEQGGKVSILASALGTDRYVTRMRDASGVWHHEDVFVQGISEGHAVIEAAFTDAKLLFFGADPNGGGRER